MRNNEAKAKKRNWAAWARSHQIVAASALGVLLLLLTFMVGKLMMQLPEFKDWLDNGSMALGAASLIVAWPLVMLAWVRRYDTNRRFQQTEKNLEYIRKSFDASLIIGVRPNNVLPEWHLCWIRPTTVAFLVSKDTWENTYNLIQGHEDQDVSWDFPQDEDHPDMVKDPYDIKEATEHCLILIRRMLNKGISAERICVDIVGGTKPMSIGAFMAAEELGVTSIYLSGKGGKQLTAADLDDEKAVEIMLLSDHRVKDKPAHG